MNNKLDKESKIVLKKLQKQLENNRKNGVEIICSLKKPEFINKKNKKETVTILKDKDGKEFGIMVG